MGVPRGRGAAAPAGLWDVGRQREGRKVAEGARGLLRGAEAAATPLVFRRFSPPLVAGEGLRRIIRAVRGTGFPPGRRLWGMLFCKFSFRSRFVASAIVGVAVSG